MGAKPIPSLTGLRGIAAIWVVLFHMMIAGRSILSDGYLGVDIFFILSGFVLAHVYAVRFRNASPRTYILFLKARIARIFPLHLAMLAVVALVVFAVPGFTSLYPDPGRRFGLECLAASAFLVQNWFHWLPGCWNSPAWSLSAEWLAYLLFPAFLFATQKWRTPIAALCAAGLCLAALTLALRLKGLYTTDVTGDPGLLRMALEFTSGCLIFRALQVGLSRLPLFADILTAVLLGGALLAGSPLPALVAFAMIVLLAAQESGWIAKALSGRLAVFLGEISYSIYLVHWIVLQFLNRLAAKLAAGAVEAILLSGATLAVILAISVLTYRIIELPARAWGRRLGVKPAASLANADAI